MTTTKTPTASTVLSAPIVPSRGGADVAPVAAVVARRVELHTTTVAAIALAGIDADLVGRIERGDITIRRARAVMLRREGEAAEAARRVRMGLAS